MAKQADICSKCKQPRSQSTPASLTQWLAVCKCGIMPDELIGAPPVQVCEACGKRVASGRAGSFTQLIFRSDLCSCNRPPALQPSAQPDSHVDEPDAMTLEELSVDERTFPLERYAPLALLGQGNAGSVYLAEDRLLRKHVAVKTAHHLSDDQLLFFQNEARAISKLTHPSIVGILDFGVNEQNSPYMVLEYVRGVALDQYLLRSGPLGWNDARLVFTKVCDALAAAHNEGVFHRDLKPSNILLIFDEQDIEVKLIDFGVATIKQQSQASTLVQGRTIVGTPSYMSPDQIMEKSFDARSEIYCLGCVLFEALTGRPPFTGESALETITLHVTSSPPELSAVAGHSLSAGIERLVSRCLEKDPDKRFQSVEAVKSAIMTVGESQEEPGETGTGSRPAVPKAGKMRAIGSILALILCLVVPIVLVTKMNDGSKPADLGQKDAGKKSPAGRGKLRWVYDRKVLTGDERVTDRDFDVISWFPGARTLVCTRSSKVTGAGFSDIAGTRVVRIVVASPVLSDYGISQIARLSRITALSVGRAGKLTDKAYESLGGMSKLRQLELSDCKLSENALKEIGRLSRLRALSIRNCKNLHSEDFKHFARLRNMRGLEFSSNHVTGELVEAICLLPHLSALSLCNSNLTDEHIEMLASRTKLSELDISDTRVSDRGLAALARMRTLKDLNIDNLKNSTQSGVDRLVEKLPECSVRVFDKVAGTRQTRETTSVLTDLARDRKQVESRPQE